MTALLPHRHGIYAHQGHQLTLMHSAEVEGRWEIFFGAEYLGVLSEVEPDDHGLWPCYQGRLPGHEDIIGENVTGSWRCAVDFLADEAGH